MKFSTYKMWAPRNQSSDDIMELLRIGKISDTDAHLGICERLWIENRSPYYRVYPVAAEAFHRASLDFPLKALRLPDCLRTQIVDENRVTDAWSLSVELAEESFIRTELSGRPVILCAAFCTICQTVEQMKICAVAQGFDDAGKPMHFTMITKRVANDTTAQEAIGFDSPCPDTDALLGLPLKVLSAHGMAVEEILAKDAGRPIPHEKKVLRAKQRGKFGFSIGKNWAVVPHLRRPHFAVRWCGSKEDGLRPELRPIKGSVIHADEIEKIPTGHHDN